MFNGGKAAREESRAARTAGRQRLAAANEQIRLRLRDEFAMAALGALLRPQDAIKFDNRIADQAYVVAEAMLEARDNARWAEIARYAAAGRATVEASRK